MTWGRVAPGAIEHQAGFDGGSGCMHAMNECHRAGVSVGRDRVSGIHRASMEGNADLRGRGRDLVFADRFPAARHRGRLGWHRRDVDRLRSIFKV